MEQFLPGSATLGDDLQKWPSEINMMLAMCGITTPLTMSVFIVANKFANQHKSICGSNREYSCNEDAFPLLTILMEFLVSFHFAAFTVAAGFIVLVT